MVLIHSRIERDGCYNRQVGSERKNGSHFIFPLASIFSRPPSESEMQSDIIKCSESLSFTLHGVRGNFKTRMGIRSCHGARPTEQTKSSLKRAARLFCISKVLLLEFVLGEYYTEMGVADLPIRRSCGSQDRH